MFLLWFDAEVSCHLQPATPAVTTLCKKLSFEVALLVAHGSRGGWSCRPGSGLSVCPLRAASCGEVHPGP